MGFGEKLYKDNKAHLDALAEGYDAMDVADKTVEAPVTKKDVGNEELNTMYKILGAMRRKQIESDPEVAKPINYDKPPTA